VNRKECLNENVQIWCKQKRIVLDSTTSYISQLNDRTERLNRILLGKIYTSFCLKIR